MKIFLLISPVLGRVHFCIILSMFSLVLASFLFLMCDIAAMATALRFNCNSN